MKLSLVLVSPSTVMALKEASATSLISCCNTGVVMAASVAINPNMVAILGQIMPEPLDMPVRVMVWPSMSIWRLPALATVSVVMMARAASSQLAGRRWLSDWVILSLGRGSRITPVENGSTWLGAQARWSATAWHTLRAASRPCWPVPALALPVLMIKARF